MAGSVQQVYDGMIAGIPLGVDGLSTDDPMDTTGIQKLRRAMNVDLGRGIIQKAPGAYRYNLTAFANGVKAVFDWWPNAWTQRLIVVDGAGRIYKMADRTAAVEITPASSSVPTVLTQLDQIHFLACGAESANRSKKLFIFNGKDAVQVISADGTTRSNLSGPAADWSGSSQPSFAFMFRSRVVAIGCSADPHRWYASDDDNHETFSSGGAQGPVFPGEGDRLFSGGVFKGKAMFFKRPSGSYFLNDYNSADPTEWGSTKYLESFGVASAHAMIEVLDDVFVATATGSVVSLAATQAFGDLKMGDLLSALRNESFMRNTTSPQGALDRHAIYYEDKKQALFAYRSKGAIRNDRILVVDLSIPGSPRVTWLDCHQPNYLGQRRDVRGVKRPMYGASDGYVYIMDRPDRVVGDAGYRMDIQTQSTGFGFLDPQLNEVEKRFDFVEPVFEATGRWDVQIETHIDGVYYETVTFQPSFGGTLGPNDGDDRFTLDGGSDAKKQLGRLSGRTARSARIPISGTGRRISFRIRDEGNPHQNVKLLALRCGFQPLNFDQRERAH